MARADRDIVLRRVKEKKRFKRLVWSYFILFLSAVLFLILVLLSHWERLAIEQIEISGNRAVESSEIDQIVRGSLGGNYFYTFSRRNIFSYPRSTMKQKLMAEIPYLGGVDFNITENILQVTVTEREPRALWCLESDCYYIDETGFVFSLAPNFSDNIFLKISGPGASDPVGTKPVALDLFSYIMNSAQLLPTVFLDQDLFEVQIFKVNIIDDRDYEFVLSQSLANEKIHWTLKFSRQNDFLRELDNLSTVLASENFQEEYRLSGGRLEYIDLRFGNKIFYLFD